MMNTMRMVTKIYTMNKVFSSNERVTSKRDLEWMGERKGNGCWGGGLWSGTTLENVIKLRFSYTLEHQSPNMCLPIFGF